MVETNHPRGRFSTDGDKPPQRSRSFQRSRSLNMKQFRQYLQPLIILIVFEAVAVTLWLTKNNIFYLFNFSYIGLSISLGLFLFINKYKYARRIVQLLVGLYMLVYLGLICHENMQIEGFWYIQGSGASEKEDRMDPLYHICLVAYFRISAVSCKSREHRKDHVLGVHYRKYCLLRHWHSACICTERQPGILQIYLPDHGLFKANELFFSDPH